jgi:hypothetical protein
MEAIKDEKHGQLLKRKRTGKRNIGAKVNQLIWGELRAKALRECRPSGDLLEEAIELYLKK